MYILEQRYGNDGYALGKERNEINGTSIRHGLSKKEADLMFPIALILSSKQPDVYERIIKVFHIKRVILPEPEITLVLVPEDELTPEQRMLDRLMRQRPRPGKGG